MKRLNNLIGLLGFLVTAAAILDQMQRPADARTWHGKVLDFFPYDFRMPSLERVKERMWNPESNDIVTPMVFGVGWTVNAAALYKMGQYFSAGMSKEA
ncbi:MAG: DUF5808 domain-containing protein [Chloroflexota bacterium]